MIAGRAPMGGAWVGLGFGPYDVFGDPVDLASAIATDVLGDPISMMGLVYSSFVGIGPTIADATEITGKIYDLKTIGYWPKIKDYPVPGSRRTIKIHEGAEGPGIQFLVKWLTDRNSAYAFLNQLALIEPEDYVRFYLRDSLWYLRVYMAGHAPYFERNRADLWSHEVKLWFEDPYMYSEIHQEWNVTAGTLPQVSEAMDNYGHVADGFESISITGHYNWLGLGHMEDVVLSVADGYSMTLSDHLLKDEVITLEVDGSLSTSWTCGLYNLAHFIADAPAYSGVTFDTDHIMISAAGYAIIDLAGPWPTKKPVKMTATMYATGTAKVQISTDGGATYTDAVATADIVDGISSVYYLTGTAKAADIKIKLTAPTGYMTIYAIKIERELDCSGADLPVVQPGAAKAFTVSCDVTKSTSATIAAEYHPRREAI
jgi:hypothetical protein